MSRTTVLVLVAVGAGLAGFALSTSADRLADDASDRETSAPAGPQRVALRWRETYGTAGEQLVFSVNSFEVSNGGWQARISVENDTSISYEVGDPEKTLDRSFGLMLFSTGELEELERLNAEQMLPPVRHAVRYEPRPPRILEPGASWSGTMSAPGALVAGSWVRLVFGPLVSVGNPPGKLDDYVVWITDHAHRLSP